MISTEVALLVPVTLFGFVLVIVAGGRIVQAESEVMSAAQEAARAATFHDSKADADVAAASVATANLQTSGLSCALGSDVSMAVLPPPDSTVSRPSGMEPGSVVAVTVSCTADLSDVVAVGVPGSRTFRAEAFERVDVFRSNP